MARVKRRNPIASRKKPRHVKRPHADGTDGGTVWLLIGPVWLKANAPKFGRKRRITVRGGKVKAKFLHAKVKRGR